MSYDGRSEDRNSKKVSNKKPKLINTYLRVVVGVAVIVFVVGQQQRSCAVKLETHRRQVEIEGIHGEDEFVYLKQPLEKESTMY